MKKLLFSISLTLIAAASFGQANWNLDFETPTYLSRVLIDTTSNPNNIWQIGPPNKTVFTSAHSSPNVIVTDTLNSYPINDTSSFTIIHIVPSYGWPASESSILGWYNVNSDTLTDYGYIEFSTDLGNTWFSLDNIMNHGCCFSSAEVLPTFTGNSNGWQFFYYCLCSSNPLVAPGDTVLYRFTFISDSIQTNKDGLMFDDLTFVDLIEGIDENQNSNLVSFYPNPFTDNLTITLNKKEPVELTLYDITARKLLQQKFTTTTTITTAYLASGIYIYEVRSDRGVVKKGKVVKE